MIYSVASDENLTILQGASFVGLDEFPNLAGGGGAAPTIVGTPVSSDGFSTLTLSVGTVSVNDIVDYYVTAQANGQAFTVTLSGGCAASGGNVVDSGPTNQGFIAATAQKGHFLITTGGACTINASWAAPQGGTLSGAVIRGSSGVDVVATINNQNAAGTTANAVTSGTAITTTHNDLCVAATWDSNLGGGTLTAGNTIAWTLGTPDAVWPSGNEYFRQSSSGAIQATFTFSVSPYTQTGLTCYKP